MSSEMSLLNVSCLRMKLVVVFYRDTLIFHYQIERVLTLGGGLPYLEHLNLSGCLTVTGAGLQDLVSACPSLNDEYFYYCDNINGPHADTASGCQNLQCGFRACCRSGE
ncbi:hypothetical protein EI555_021676 [Monodon monoceros]|uniref:Uncharacterized protein n=1 Tax=Monodon monoceros TaxID=40151 RepID=A0A4U1EM20_MONMO|nr:hypothetical protein EI555_021676 [Monodon monoceros]